MWSTCSLLARAGITCYSFHALCITADRIGLTAAAVQECAQPHLHSGHAPYYNTLSNRLYGTGMLQQKEEMKR
jgi:hypothetical protein